MHIASPLPVDHHCETSSNPRWRNQAAQPDNVDESPIHLALEPFPLLALQPAGGKFLFPIAGGQAVDGACRTP
jgi:hypothetical protein